MNKKQELRRSIAQVLKELDTSKREKQSKVILDRISRHPKYIEAKRISVYLSTDREVDTIPLLQKAIEQDGKKCYIPFVRKLRPTTSEPRMVMVELRSMKLFESLKVNHYGIKEPTDEETWTRADPILNPLDLVIVPGVAFTLKGHRLGHGRGYYDEFLSHWACQASERVYTIGLALKEQLVEDVFADDETDYKLDEIFS